MLVVVQYSGEGRLLATKSAPVMMNAPNYRFADFSGHKDDYVYGIFLVNAKN